MINRLLLDKKLGEHEHPATVYLNSRQSENTRYNMERHLNLMAQLLTNDEECNAIEIDWAALRYADTAHIHASLINLQKPNGKLKYSASTINVILSALRGVLKQAWLLGQMSAEDYHRAIIIENVKEENELSGRRIKYGEIQAVANVCFDDKSDAGARDSAIIGLMATCGLRRSEVVKLQMDDIDIESGKLDIVSGKGNKSRNVWLRGGALLAMEDWLHCRNSELTTTAVFIPINKGGNQEDRQMTSQSVYKIVQKRGKEANVDGFSPHDFRRTMISTMLEHNTDLLTVQKIVGHASPSTTQRYDLRSEQQKKGAAERLHYPHRPRRQQTLI